MTRVMKSGTMNMRTPFDVVRTRVGIALAAGMLGLSLASPAAAAAVRPIRFERMTLEHGLSQSTVMDVLQDQRGYVWLATEDGLNRFDGISFKVYRHDPADAASLPSSFVWDVEEDDAGNLWIATSAGLALWERNLDRMVRREEVVSGHIRMLLFDAKEKALWIGTRDAGLRRLDLTTGAVTSFTHDANATSLGDDRVYALYLDRKGRLWVGTDAGLDRFEAGSKRFVHYAADAEDKTSLSDPRVRTILEDDMGTLWIGTNGGGLNRLDEATGTFERFRHDNAVASSLADDRVRALLQDADGRM